MEEKEVDIDILLNFFTEESHFAFKDSAMYIWSFSSCGIKLKVSKITKHKERESGFFWPFYLRLWENRFLFSVIVAINTLLYVRTRVTLFLLMSRIGLN
jgi:hypothetical protein